ncbi:PREDICTED: uncharacterized protein LOC109591852 [Amphimedon queenslandica]|uniref:Death domain-containing protein n=1 Tax=Amphimedon queenslandica TaxID=400682 RepID=A0A1X7SR41_AMPQE|nr:PREDICTED: uncharacterized protein LOC109591852 [Amphimedon queenslandica]|eukprot:XP_019863025.1 PREDICTED: uncharacterized protein LOC109591852 [Amphimedon queenslandica]
MKVVSDSAGSLSVEHNHVNAFSCPKDKSCYCVIEEDFEVNCTSCDESADIQLSDAIASYWCWFDLDCGPKVVTSDSEYSQTLNISCLDQILTDMKEGHFRNCSWFDLGLKLGLYDTTLSDIESNSTEVEECLRKCIAKWLEGADGVNAKGRPSWTTLVKALEQCDKRSTADHIRCKRLTRAAHQ